MRPLVFILFILMALSNSCVGTNDKTFVLLSAERTGIDFNNKITETKELNPLNFIYMYNGAGVAAGDINNDGLPDLFFSGNSVGSRLYINKGNFQFEDVTATSKILKEGWATGVNFIDINTDGFLDIYVCMADKDYTSKGENRLYINQGNNTFVESASKFGLNDPDYSTQSVFFDYDKDGDLDMYLLTNAIESFSHNSIRRIKVRGEGKSTDKLYRNNGDDTFTNVSDQAGITIEGYGLGVAILDVNYDSWPDIYCSNDFITNDLLWINNGDGTFTNGITDFISQTSHNGMGIDVADYNNDALLDIVEVDMLPESNMHNKIMTPAMNFNNQNMRFNLGYMPQYVRNTLQLRNNESNFSEIGRLAGIQKTDWSWAPLFADLDNDGHKDLFISNGYGRDITDLDFINYSQTSSNPYTSKEIREQNRFEALDKLPPIDLPNYFYKNRGDLTFENVTGEWETGAKSMSNGAVYVDLDGDGDLDIVTNNINQEAFVYKNQSVEKSKTDSNFLRLKLKGPSNNPDAIGATVYLYEGNVIQRCEQTPVRGYLSSVDYILHFGLGSRDDIDSLKVDWPDGKVQLIKKIKANRLDTLYYKNAKTPQVEKELPDRTLLVSSQNLTDDISHLENSYIDFQEEPLLLKMLSREGPGLAVGDVNNDGLEDFMMTTALNDTTFVYLQNKEGGFEKGPRMPLSWKHEQLGSLLFDANGDGKLDAYIASGGNEISFPSDLYQDQLYLQMDDGSFEISNKLPTMSASSSTVNACDFDNDGDLDLFVGSRLLPKSYPYPGKSFILENDKGVFKDVTSTVAPQLSDIGLVTSALWTDFNNDNYTDLIVVGEWMEISFFENKKDKLVNVTSKSGVDQLRGFWNSINGADFDLDGDIDYIVGNIGGNVEYKASKKEPLTLLAKDFDNNGRIDPVLGYYLNGENFPYPSRDALVSQISVMKKKFPFYRDYGKITFDQLFEEEELVNAISEEINITESIYIENRGNGNFSYKKLPIPAQKSPVYGISTEDINNDGFADILVVGNRRDTETLSGYLDGSIGSVLIGNGKGFFEPATANESGFMVVENARSLAPIATLEGMNLLVGNNNGALQSFRVNKKGKFIEIAPDDRYALVTLNDDHQYKIEFYHGSGYLSQGSRNMVLPSDFKEVTIFNSRFQGRAIRNYSSTL